jgi:predicted dehydrogenase
MGSNRRDFLHKATLAGMGMAVAPNLGFGQKMQDKYDIKPNLGYMGGFAAPKLGTVRCAFIGVGARGSGHASQIASIEGTEVVAICDLYLDLAEKAANECKEIGKTERHKNIALYTNGENDWRNMLKEQKPDAVFIATPWEWHAPMAIGAMEEGTHAFVEVPIATTLKDMWDIVDASERTQKHCMMMENVNYGREELLYLNMCRQGVIGELLHGEAAYIHELRSQMNEVERGTGSWRTYQYAKRNGNLYPTHGLGPIAQYMNIARADDNFRIMTSFSSPGKGRNLYAKKNFPADHKWNQLDFIGGDINTSIIKTHMGRTILVQWDETSPRPYSRLNLIQGTQGTLAGFPTRIALEGGVEGGPDTHHEWAEGEQLAKIYEKYEHPLYKRLGELAIKMGGHGGMDFMMLYRIIECLREGQPLDQNVYEGCLWSAVGPLSEASVAADGMPQKFPDFTRGSWKSTKPLEIIA